MPNRFQEHGARRKHPAIVGQAGKACRIQNIVIAEADDDGEENRAAGEENKTNNPWRSAEPAAGPLRAEVAAAGSTRFLRSEEHTSELQSQSNLVCRLLLANKK